MKRHSFKLVGSAWGITYDRDFRPVTTEKCMRCGMVRLLIGGRFSYGDKDNTIHGRPMECDEFKMRKALK